MDAYPRATTWPYVLTVTALFLAAAFLPRWWRSLDPEQRQEIVTRASSAVESISSSFSFGSPTDLSENDLDAPRDTDLKPVGSGPQLAELRPPIGQRIVIEPHDVLGESELDAGQPSAKSLLQLGPTDSGSAAAIAEFDAREFELHHVLSVLPDRPEPVADVGPTSEWPRPSGLLRHLEELCSDVGRVERWRMRGIGLIAELQATLTLDHSDVPLILSRLAEMAEVAEQVEREAAEADRVTIRQIAYGIERRVAVWRAIHALACRREPPPIVLVSDGLPLLKAVEDRLADAEHGDAWHSYLLLDKLHQIATSTWETDASVRYRTSREVLARMQDSELTEQQMRFLDDPALIALASELRRWAQAPVDLPKLTQTLEQFETARSGRLASRIIQDLHSLQWIDNDDAKRLTSNIETHYRNANIRIAITEQLVNDLLPVMEPIQEQVQDQILGASVRGRNDTWTRLRVRLIEARDQIRLRFEAAGNTRSNTVSTKGPIRFYTRGNSAFEAGKDISLSRRGLWLADATAVARGRSRLTNIESEYDQIPLLGWILRQMAADELWEMRDRMRREVDGRVSRAARERLNESLAQRADDVERRLADRLIDPLRNLRLDPTALEMRSTRDRMVMRCRIASSEQLAAYTPRPRALRNSVLSMQLHESSANNLFQQLELSGKRLELDELVTKLAGKLQIDPADINDELPEGVSVRLGHDRPVQVHFEDDRVLVTVRIAELTTRKKKWRSFVVRGRYRADVNRMHIDLEREGGIELISDRLAFRDQIALRGIFTKVMSKNHRLNIIRGRFVDDPRLANLRITQFVVRDGWMGISVGPQTAQHVAIEADVILN